MASNNTDINDDSNGDFDFDLPPITEGASGFIGDEIEWTTESVNDDPNTEKVLEHDFSETPVHHLSEAEQQRGRLSSKGDAYDPAIHRYPPKETKTGIWFKKTKKQRGEQQQDEKPQVTNALFDKAGQSHANIYAGMHTLIYGDGAKPVLDETLPLAQALSRYYQDKGLTDFSPKGEVIFQALNYSFNISTRPDNVAVTKMLFMKGKEKVLTFFYFLKGKKRTARVHDIKTGAEVKQKPQPKTGVGAADNLEGLYPDGKGSKH